MVVIQATGKAKGLEPWVSITYHTTPFIIVHLLHNFTGGGVHHPTRTAKMVRNNAVGHIIFDEVVGNVRFSTIDKATDDSALCI